MSVRLGTKWMDKIGRTEEAKLALVTPDGDNLGVGYVSQTISCTVGKIPSDWLRYCPQGQRTRPELIAHLNSFYSENVNGLTEVTCVLFVRPEGVK